MSEHAKRQSAVAAIGFLVSLGLFVVGGRSGSWTLFVLFAILNPLYLIAHALFLVLNSALEWVDLRCPEIAQWITVLVASLWWWWFIGGIVALKLKRRDV